MEHARRRHMPNLREWREVEFPNETRPNCQVKLFPQLQELEILSCATLKKIGGGQSQGNLTSLRCLKIYNCPELMDFPCEMVESLAPSLKELALVGLRSLKTLPKLLDSLTKPTANSSSEILTFCSLETLWLDVSMEWLRESSVAMKQTVDVILQGCCNSLTWLRLKGMEVWDSLPESIQHLTALSKFSLQNIGVEELPEWFGNLSSLTQLHLYNCNNLRRLPSMDAMQRLTNLREISIRDCSNELVIDPKCFDIPHLYIDVDGRRIDHRST